MFTGLIEEVGKIKHLKPTAQGLKLSIAASKVLEDAKIGDSIATQGVCLTITEMDATSFTVDVMKETISRSSLKALKVGALLNLERSVTLNTRLGGHMVSGHVDGVGSVQAIEPMGIATLYTIRTPEHLLKYIVEKGSIACDGISLTVVRVDASSFQVSIVPHTQAHTSWTALKIGDMVNLEVDMMAKYVEKILAAQAIKKGPHDDDPL